MLQPPGHRCFKFFGSTNNAPPIIHKQASSGQTHFPTLKQTCHICPTSQAKPNSIFCVNNPRTKPPQAKSSLMLQPPGHRCFKFLNHRMISTCCPQTNQVRPGFLSYFETDMLCLLTKLGRGQAWFYFFVSITPDPNQPWPGMSYFPLIHKQMYYIHTI